MRLRFVIETLPANFVPRKEQTWRKPPAIFFSNVSCLRAITDMDVYAPERWRDDALFHPEVRSAYAKLQKQGWTDALRTLYPDERMYTFWKYFRNAFARDAGLRIDHFLLSPDLRKKLRAGGVNRNVRGWQKTSDHAPAWIDLDIKGLRA